MLKKGRVQKGINTLLRSIVKVSTVKQPKAFATVDSIRERECTSAI